MIETLIQSALVALLLLTMGWCALLYRAVSRLRMDQGELRELIVALEEATERADHAVMDMRNATLQGDRRAREQEAMVERRAAELRGLMVRASQIALKINRGIEASTNHREPPDIEIERESTTHSSHDLRAPRRGPSSRRAPAVLAGRGSGAPAERRRSKASERQALLAALEHIQ